MPMWLSAPRQASFHLFYLEAPSVTSCYEEGSPDASILVLAEAPARSELREQRPLVGPSGHVFNDCLHTAGIARSQCYILNVWPYLIYKAKKGNTEYFYPYDSPRGPSDLLWQTGKGFTEFGLAEAEPTLERIRASSANIILTMGQQAMDLATGKAKAIGKWRGSPLTGLPRVGSKRVIPTFHPAATLHGVYIWRYIIISDMEKTKRFSLDPTLGPPARNLIINPSFDDVMSYMTLCTTKPRLATDLEVINHQISCFCLCHDHMEAMTVPIGDEYGKPWWDEEQEIAIWDGYARLMGAADIEKINQNLIGFDAPFLIQQNNIYTKGFLGDTMIAQHILYPEFNKGLDFICSIHTDEPYYKDEGKMWKGLGGDIEQFWRYNGKDGCVALEAWDVLAVEMTEGDFWPTYNMTAALANPLMYMTVRGFKVDMDKMQAVKSRVEDDIAVRIAELKNIVGFDLNHDSPKQVAKYFYETKKLTPYKNAQGGITTDDKALARIFRKTQLREAKLIQELRGLGKLKGTYLEIAFDKDLRLRSTWNPRGTWTGRLSSGQTIFGTGANMQNLSPTFLDFLVAD